MSNYWDSRFLKHIEINNVKITFEVGARYGEESIQLKKILKNSIIHSFECNPKTVDTCKLNLKSVNNIIFNNFGLGDKEEHLPFYSYTKNNDGASSLLKRIDFDKTQIYTGNIKIKTLENYVKENNIQRIDVLCMDVQGYELNVLKGAGDFIKKINYIIMEEPKPIINCQYLPDGIHSKYINAPTSHEINKFMTENGFIEIERIEENKIEDNVMYKNINNI
jgi:FkbM family methyltransferase